MKYIHDSAIGSHGKLRSGSCLINSRWVLKIANAGLHWLRDGGKQPKDTFKDAKGGYFSFICYIFVFT